MMVFSLALRNLMRNRRRSLTTLSAMIVGLLAILIFGGYARNAVYATQTGYVQFHGHLQLQRKGYFLYGSANPEAYGIAGYQRIIDVVKADPVLQPMLTVVTPSLRLSGIAGNFANGLSRSVIAVGLVAGEQNRMRQWDDYGSLTYAPKIALEGTAADAAVIGTGVARLLQLCGPLKVRDCPQAPEEPSGDGPAAPADVAALSAGEAEQAAASAGGTSPTAIEMLAANVHGAPNVARLDVVRADNWGVKEIDDALILMHLEQAQRLIFGGGTPQVTAIQIQLKHTSQMPAARARLQALLASTLKDAPLEIQDYETLTPIYGQIIQFFDSVFGFIAILIGVIVLFTVGNTMSMAVVERTTEIGTLRAIGQRRGGVRRLFFTEGLLLGVIGAVLGVLLALPVAWLINHSGLTWAPPGYSYAYPVMVRVWGDARLILGSAVGMISIAVVSAWWPARRASQLNIVDALRHV
jgi:putative ABC transport system permease protein